MSGLMMSGTGPLAVQDEEILRTSRILAVANAFVGMISPRAYRGPLTFEQVTDELLEQAGGKLDRKPVSALINVIENRGGSERWAHYREVPGES